MLLPASIGLATLLLSGDLAGAVGHPAPYPHRHYTRVRPHEHPARPRRVVDPYRRSRLYVGLGVVGTYVLDSDENALTQVLGGGAGFSATFGIRMQRWAGLEATWTTTFHETGPSVDFSRALLSSFTLNARIFLIPRAQRLEPFVQLGAGAYLMNRDGFGTDTLSGIGMQAGGGVDIRLSSALTICARVLYRGAYIDNRLADMGHRAAAGIRLAVRLGDGHPGARLWTTRRGKPYLGRNAKAYPGDQDTDERYFAYLRRLVSKLKGRVGSYTVGDELDSQFGCDSHTPRRLREYYDFFVRAARVIHSVDPAAEVVMFPPAWGYERALADLAMMCQWGYREAGSGIALNVAFGRLRRPERLHTFVTGVRSLSPQFKLYSNGVGYCMDRFPEREQAVRVFHTMFKLWDAGWSQAPYYLLGSHRHLWSSGLVSRGADGQLVRRAAWAAFQTCAQVFYDRAACKRPGFGIEVQPAGDGLGVPGRKYMVNGPASDAALFSYVRGRELLLVLMQYAFDSDTTTRVNVRVRSGHFRHPVRVPMLSPRGRRDVAYELLPDGSVRLQGLMVTAEPTIVRMVAEP